MNDKKIVPLLEEILPRQFIYDIGLYLQTCAHIELTTCSLICRLEKQDEGSDMWWARFHELRKFSIKDLVRQLKQASRSLDDTLQRDFDDFVGWIDTYKINRHIAAHGAFQSMPGGNMRVHYTHIEKINGQKVYTKEETVLSRQEILDYVYDADRILRTLSGLDNAIRTGDVSVRS
ncbi:MAG: hypothetical protein AAGO57_07015 [Pseudomonadota bacterium]